MGVILILIAVVLLVFLVPAIFQWLWNITMPQVFGLRPVTYWIAFRLLIIADILFPPATSGFTESRRIKCSNVRRTPRGTGGSREPPDPPIQQLHAPQKSRTMIGVTARGRNLTRGEICRLFVPSVPQFRFSVWPYC